MRWLMSDVALSRSPWWKSALFFALMGLSWIFSQVPVLIRRGEYARLKDDLDYLVEDAHRALNENYKLRQELRAAQGLPEFETDDE